jgi:hypothetical protein
VLALVAHHVSLASASSSARRIDRWFSLVAPIDLPTGLTKVGCFIGDHTKTGLGTLLNTGTSAGVFCNLLPAGLLLPKYIPSFCSCWTGQLTAHADLPQLLGTAEALKLGSYPISIIPDQDCCTLFTPRHPATRARVSDVERAEATLPMQEIIARAVAAGAVEEYRFPDIK